MRLVSEEAFFGLHSEWIVIRRTRLNSHDQTDHVALVVIEVEVQVPVDGTYHENAAIPKWSRRIRTSISSTGIVKKSFMNTKVLVAIPVARVSRLECELPHGGV